MSKSIKTVPIYDINVPNEGPQKTVILDDGTPVYSSYTGNKICDGPIVKGTTCDASHSNPNSYPNYGKPFHVVEHNQVNRSWMAHGIGKSYNSTFFSEGSYTSSYRSYGGSSGSSGDKSYSAGGCSNVNIY